MPAEPDYPPSDERLTELWKKEVLSDPTSDPTRPSLSAYVDAGHPFSVPWASDAREVLTGFISTRIADTSGPWLSSCAFDLAQARLTAVLPDLRGGIASFRDGHSTHSSSTGEHLSAELGVSVGYPFLSASVSGKYDRNVIEDENSVQASRNAMCRVGRIVLDRMPSLSRDAVLLLSSKDGPARFKALYGDYFVCGYELGGDAGACLSASCESSSKTTTLELTVTVKVLFVKKSITKTTSDTEVSGSSKLAFSGYTTFGQKSITMSSADVSPADPARLQQAAAEYLTMVGDLPSDIRGQMRKLGLVDGQALRLSSCSGICESGLVVQLLLAPFARLNEYVQLLSQPPSEQFLEDLQTSSIPLGSIQA